MSWWSFNTFISLPVVLLLTTNVKFVVLGEGQFAIPVHQLQSKSVWPLIGQLVHQLISQPMFSSQTPKALKYTNTHICLMVGTFYWLLLFKHNFMTICVHLDKYFTVQQIDGEFCMNLYNHTNFCRYVFANLHGDALPTNSAFHTSYIIWNIMRFIQPTPTQTIFSIP